MTVWILNFQHHVSLVVMSHFRNKDRLMQWHNRRGHLSIISLHILFPSYLDLGLSMIFIVWFVNCLSMFRTLILLVLIIKVLFHSLWCTLMFGGLSLPLLFGFRYFVSFFDDYSQCTWVYLMKTKEEVYFIFYNFHKMV